MMPGVRSTSLWEVPAREGREVLTSREVADMAARVGIRPENALRHLRREGYLLPLFRGYYYVRSPEEIRLGRKRLGSLELFSLAARKKGIGPWYFGLETALRLNGLTHEDRREETVVSANLYRIGGVPIGGTRFVIHKWGPELFGFGIVRHGSYRFSDREKTVLDLAYLDFWRSRRTRARSWSWVEYLSSVDVGRLRRYLRHYPTEVRKVVRERL